MIHRNCHVQSCELVADNVYQLCFDWDDESAPQPGHFFTVRAGSGIDPLLRRPFAFSGYDIQKATASSLIYRRGNASTVLTALTPGDEIDVIGPLGSPFPLPDPQKPVVLLSGGIGLGPIHFLGTRLTNQNMTLFCGARNALSLPGRSFFGAMNPRLCTDDGSTGFAGTVVDGCAAQWHTCTPAAMYACGPTPMLAACHRLAVEKNIPCYVSMEQIMACGVGACMGCVIKSTRPQGYVRVCSEGPVFDSRELIWT